MTKEVWHHKQDQRIGCRQNDAKVCSERVTRERMQKNENTGACERRIWWGEEGVMRILWLCNWGGQRWDSARMVWGKKKQKKTRTDGEQSSHGKDGDRWGQMWRVEEERSRGGKDGKLGRKKINWTHSTVYGELDCRWVQMTWNWGHRLEKLWMELRTIEKRERCMVRIYVQCMRPLLYIPL